MNNPQLRGKDARHEWHSVKADIVSFGHVAWSARGRGAAVLIEVAAGEREVWRRAGFASRS